VTGAVGFCDHCTVPLMRWRAWPDVGAIGECPTCKSSFLRRGHLMAAIREDLVLANMAARIAAGPILADLDRWIRAFAVVAAHYKLEADFASAKRCDDAVVGLAFFQRGGSTPLAAVLTAVLP
jgi:hypothetical protein